MRTSSLVMAGCLVVGLIMATECAPGGAPATEPSSSVAQPEARRPLCDEVLPAGQESAIEKYLGDHTAGKDAEAFANPLDQAFAILVASVWPVPQPMALAEGAVAALCEEFRRQGGKEVSAEDRREWASAAARTGHFENVFEGLQKLAAAPLRRPALMQAALKGMLAKSGWSEATVLGEDGKAAFKQLQAARDKPSEEPGRIGLKLDHWPQVEVLPQSPAAEAGMKTGNVIVKVNGKDAPAAAGAAEAMKLLAGPAGKVVTLSVRRDEASLELRVQRVGAGVMAVTSARLDGGVLLVQISTLEGQGIGEKVCRLVREGAEKAPAIILDVRDNPGGRAEEADAIAGAFLDGKLLDILEFRSGKRIGYRSPAAAISAKPVVVLMNRDTASAAEMLAMALHDNGRASLIGETSAGCLFGKDLGELKDGSVILFRTEPTVLSPSGKDYSVRGIPPERRMSRQTGGRARSRPSGRAEVHRANRAAVACGRHACNLSLWHLLQALADQPVLRFRRVCACCRVGEGETVMSDEKTGVPPEVFLERPTLTTARLVLRPHELADAPRLQQLAGGGRSPTPP